MNVKSRIWPAAMAALLFAAGSAAHAGRGYHSYHPHHHHGSRVQFGITFGAPLWYPGPFYYPAHPVYALPAPVVVQAAPKIYVERDAAQAAPAAANSSPVWFYCRESNTYYPYVRECAGDWERVPARPASAR